MIIGAHSILYSKDAEADRAFLRDVLGFPNVDVGGGWLIFGLPPAEVAIDPSQRTDVRRREGIPHPNAEAAHPLRSGPEPRLGLLTQVTLPGGGKLGVHEPRHARPKTMRTPTAVRLFSGS